MASGMDVSIKCDTNGNGAVVKSQSSGKNTCKFEESVTIKAYNSVLTSKPWTANAGDTSSEYSSSSKSNVHFKVWTITDDKSNKLPKTKNSNPYSFALSANNVTIKASSETHSYSTKTIAPWCTTRGYDRHSCGCGYYYDDNYVAALGHNYSYWDEPVNCTGVWHRAKCDRCGDTSPTYHTGSDEHSMYVSSSRAATCTSSGYTTYTCGNGCGYTYTNYYSALGHSMTSSTSCSGTATCSSYRVCTTRHYCTRSGCGYAKSDYPSQYKDSSNHANYGTYGVDADRLYYPDPRITQYGGTIYTIYYCNGCDAMRSAKWHY